MRQFGILYRTQDLPITKNVFLFDSLSLLLLLLLLLLLPPQIPRNNFKNINQAE